MTNPAYRTNIAGTNTPIDVDDLLVLKSNFFPGNGYSWGNGSYGALGLGITTSYSSPMMISSTAYWKQISAGNQYCVAVKTDGTTWSWGLNTYGQLGTNNINNYSNPIQIFSSNSDIIKKVITHPNSNHVLALAQGSNSAYAWGLNNYGQLGNGTLTNSSTPIALGNIDWANLSCGESYSAGLDTSGNIYSWGWGAYGQLALASNVDYSTPQQIGTPSNTWRSITCGRLHTMAIDSSGTLWGCGYNGDYELGLGNNNTGPNSFTQISAYNDWQQIYCGDVFNVGIRANGTIWSWGSDGASSLPKYGNLGQNDTLPRSVPTQIGTMTNWAFVSGGRGMVAAIKTDGTLWVWGNNSNGQLGLGDTTNRSSPVQVGSLNNWKAVSAGTMIMAGQLYSQ
jgi:alpha-tubulin suppressor-like RCC1 family protein